MDDHEHARRIFAKAVTDMAARGLLDSGDRWTTLSALARSLPDMVRDQGLDPLDAVLFFLVQGLEQFPDAVPLDEESMHAHCMREVLARVHETLMLEMDRSTGQEFRDGPPRPGMG